MAGSGEKIVAPETTAESKDVQTTAGLKRVLTSTRDAVADKNSLDVYNNNPDSSVVGQTGDISFTGVVLNSTTWTLLTQDATANHIAIKNPSTNTITVYIADNASAALTDAWDLPPGDVFSEDVKGSVNYYGKSASGTPNIIIHHVANDN